MSDVGTHTQLRTLPRIVCRVLGHAWYEENSETDRCSRCKKARRGQ